MGRLWAALLIAHWSCEQQQMLETVSEGRGGGGGIARSAVCWACCPALCSVTDLIVL